MKEIVHGAHSAQEQPADREVLFEVDNDGVATVTLNRPEVLNAMDGDTYRELTRILKTIEEDPQIRIGILSGAGERAFSAGADLRLMHDLGDADGWRAWQPDRWDLGIRVLKPMIAAVHGYALAGGLELALMCDIRIASEDARFGCPEVRWNLLHGFGATRLPQTIGLSNAMMLMLTGETIDAEEACRIGLVSKVLPRDELMVEARRLAGVMLGNADEAMQMIKELALLSLGSPPEVGMRLYREMNRRLEATNEQVERLASFGDRKADKVPSSEAEASSRRRG